MSPSHSPLSVEDRMVLSIVGETRSQPKSMGPLYHFRAEAMPLVDALALFAPHQQTQYCGGSRYPR